MTKEEAKYAIEVMQAYIDGKTIEFSENGDKWETTDSPLFDWDSFNYRIKKEPTCRPFKNKEECLNEMLKHHPFGLVKNGEKFINILNIDNIGVDFLYDSDLDCLNYATSMTTLSFVDGTPFGIKEEMIIINK